MGFISVKSLIGGGYDSVWFTNCRCRYRVLCGGRNTKKSHNMLGIEPIIKILSDPRRNIIMLRQNDVDNPDSTYSNLVQRITDMGLSHIFTCTKSPYKITRRQTGQVILFRGLNHPESITSIKPVVGYFTDVYIEEASELETYEAFRRVDGSIRGDLPEGLFFQITFALNPWDIDHWIFDKFFKDKFSPSENRLLASGVDTYYDPNFNLGFGRGLMVHTSSYKINEFRSADYDEGAELMRQASPNIYRVEFLGMFDKNNTGCYPCYSQSLVIPYFAANTYTYTDFAIGVDIGLSNGEGKIHRKGEIRSATAMTLVGINTEGKMVVMDEYYFTNITATHQKTEPEIQEELLDKIKYWLDLFPWMITRNIHIYVDSADKGFRQSLEKLSRDRLMGYLRFIESTKLPIHNRISFINHLMAFGELLISEKCVNLIREFKQAHRGKDGEMRDGNDHTIDSMEYASTPMWRKMRRYATFKG